MEEEKDNVRFIDAESWTGQEKEKLTFREIVLSHLKKIGTFSSVEFRGGYWQPRKIPVGNMQTITQYEYVPDSREVYSNSVEYLYDILFPHLDKETLEAGKKAEERIQKAYRDKTVLVEPDREDETQEEAKKKRREFADDRDKVSFRSLKRQTNRKLFRALCVFLKKKDYMKGKVFEEEV